MAGLKEIAEKAGVSIRTVSRALHDLPDINAATKRKIRKIAEKQAYRPHFAAQSLRKRETRIIGLIRSGATAEIENRRIQRITEKLHESGYCLLQGLLHDASETDALFNKFEDICDGLIVLHINGNASLPVRLKKLAKAAYPFILLDPEPALAKAHLSVNIDRENGVADAIASLAGSGKTGVAFLTPHPEYPNRFEGFKKGLARLKLLFSVDRLLLAEKPAGAMENGYRTVLAGAEIGKSINALFCFDDKTALGALRALHERGLKVPQEVAVIGFDDDSYAAYTYVPLSTVAQPVEEPAEAAVRLLLDQIAGRKVKSVEFKTTFIKRAST